MMTILAQTMRLATRTDSPLPPARAQKPPRGWLPESHWWRQSDHDRAGR